ncbi:response regulator [Pseudonocardia sp. KRD-184]|uniref:Response regulator n=1 Tax=Pseudonocardia oceani TaxID=2792013 RepID=A0ABS6UET6_9PSEU|nr:response regulator [Pseudonocardia oceani]MBW0093328.1 response regulator [Pseudonocardia oceani]MBW0097010.1 response regulator [Pseudonocardia oceani]MBW0109787.1 response regulator [Pseudonocardia oceani]MBW0123764.1 response regulator [Pseudonocardia oceani]MBW0130763.1 response regulator [Pseudonocardia oceani]
MTERTEALRGRVLVVDDDPVNRLLLRRALEREGLDVELAVDGGQGWELVSGGGFDLVLLDIVMPVLDGYAVLARMRAQEATAALPVVVISGSDDRDGVVRCIELGADDFLPKPFDPAVLRARLGAGLARKRLADLEREYREQVGHVVDAAAAVERGEFHPGRLDAVAARDDALGLLARVFGRMAHEVAQREQRLRAQVGALRIEIDEARAARTVAAITETDYFADLQRRAADLRSGTGRQDRGDR